ncbi:MAG TPA: class I SAM-dependent methyltransferase [Ktedonobacterales bacterium]|jgi:ubiquinone/menaquinone biosynthesis C-methylase UbiE
MRMGVIPSSAVEWAAVRFDLGPIPAVEAIFGMLHSRAIMAGVRLGIFEALAGPTMTAAELASRLRLEPEGTRLLCDALVAGRYLQRDSARRYALTRRSRRYLLATSPAYVGHYVEYNYDQWDWMGHLEDAVRTGRALDVHQTLDAESGGWVRYLEGLADLARASASEIAAKVPMPARLGKTPRRLLDVGGGHGTFSVALCRRYGDLEAEILDLPPSAAAGEPIARRYAGPGVADRVHYRPGDALDGALGPEASYDAVLIFQLLHHLPVERLPDLFRRAVAVLRPGGSLSVIDLLEPAHGRPPDATAAYAALHFHLTSGGQSYTPEQVEAWMAGAGCIGIRRRSLLRVPGQPLISGFRGPATGSPPA